MKTKRGSWAWFWQSVTGIALLLLVGLHMIAHHFIAEGGIRDFRQVVEYLSNPFIVVVEIAFLITVTVHAVLGVRSIIFDLGLSERSERVVTYASMVIGALTVAYGFWLMYAILGQEPALSALLFR